MPSAFQRATVTLPRPVLKRVDRLARAQYRSRSDIVRHALMAYLDRGAAIRRLHPDDFDAAVARIPLAEPLPDEIAIARRARKFGRDDRMSLDEFNRRIGYVARRTKKKRDAPG